MIGGLAHLHALPNACQRVNPMLVCTTVLPAVTEASGSEYQWAGLGLSGAARTLVVGVRPWVL